MVSVENGPMGLIEKHDQRGKRKMENNIIKFISWNQKERRMFKVAGFLNDVIFEDRGCELFPRINFDHCKLLQYTGEKDKNKNEIYEGHILKYTGMTCLFCGQKLEEKNEKLFIIKRNKSYFECIEIGKNKHDFMPHGMWNELEIVGDIYQNPELLE